MLTSFSDDEALFTAIMAGASGYLLKQVSGTDLVGAVRRLAAGESLLDPALTTAVLERLRNPDNDEDPRYESLTEQERRILAEIAAGKTNRQIAQSMFLAEKTVKNYVSGLLRKLGMERRTEAAVYAVERAKRRPER
jgi:DNA-binding NarL/FixJ family response regulator